MPSVIGLVLLLDQVLCVSVDHGKDPVPTPPDLVADPDVAERWAVARLFVLGINGLLRRSLRAAGGTLHAQRRVLVASNTTPVPARSNCCLDGGVDRLAGAHGAGVFGAC